jgi:hypothetical protein
MSIEVRAFDASVDIGRVTAKSRKGAVNVAVRPDEDAEINGRWFVELGLPEDAPVEAVDDVIDVTTGVPGEEKIELTVVGEVVAKAK